MNPFFFNAARNNLKAKECAGKDEPEDYGCFDLK